MLLRPLFIFATSVAYDINAIKNPRTDISDLFPELNEKKLGREIEVKIKLNKNQRDGLRKWLHETKEVTSKGKVEQQDIYFDNPEKTFLFDRVDKYGKKIKDFLRSVRIRFSNKKKSVNTKLRYVDSNWETLSRDEFEKEMTREEAGKLYKKWKEERGYTETFEVKKVREVYSFGDLEIAFDTIKSLDDATFVEIEVNKKGVDVQTGMTMIYGFLKKRGITEFVQYDHSYLHMVIDPGHNFGYKKAL
ncbi:MAG: CYTH domain-containing protein [bacterium]